jgi:formylglycine-generating enzyme required for sulfatase activity
MYFWHPAYDSYPVVNISYNQVMAFCEWKQRQINASSKDAEIKVEISIPTLAQYEFSLKQTTDYTHEDEVHSNVNSTFATYERSFDEMYIYLKKVYGTYIIINKKSGYEKRKVEAEFNRWYSENYNKDLRFINGNVSEMVLDSVTLESLMRYGLSLIASPEDAVYSIGSNYKMGVKSVSDDQFNSVFYKQLIYKNNSSATTGFRLAYKVIRKD